MIFNPAADGLDSIRARVRDDLLVDRGHNDAVIWSPGWLEPAYLDPVSTLLLAVFDGEATAAEVAGDVEAVFEIDRESAENQVMRTLMLFQEAGALDISPTTIPPLEGYRPAPDW